MVWYVWGLIGIQSNDITSRECACIHTQPLLTPTVCNYYLLCPNHLETCLSLVRGVSYLGKVQKVIPNSHHRGTTVCCVWILWYSCHTIKTLNAHWPSGKADWTPDYSHPTPMQWSFSSIRDFSPPLVMWRGECPDHVDLAILQHSYPQEEMNTLSIYLL